ncbi:MAG: PIN domain-containing protein [Gammaproteobacteria bacterium]|nr:PIN domain-containing protein [Limnobacter sp.]MBU0783884.1 PIN domain-containing protein [Gammaproteobacteria bacterium]MDP2380492.1 PIN domain-containing protein [Pseudohongiella sp.]MBU0848780.1 PIN domain-containing protein [Gammaproteobacteria bacterium]MBU1266462.1 PIN domain-containing protein [Gammaproteobacteria bacterium]MBU1528142.1 PIN domain-containing protein [Gammaproteobacteria bacterium]
MSVVFGKPDVPQHWLLDANVLFSEWTRWLVVTLAKRHQATLYWTPQIENECYRNLVRLGRLHPDDAVAQRAALPQLMDAVVLPQAHQPYLVDVRSVDEKDRHVAASALALKHHVQAPVAILTWNLKDFPRKPLLKLGLVRFSPDELCLESLKKQGDALSCLVQTVAEMNSALLIHRPIYPTVYQVKAAPLPTDLDEWLAFLARNKMHRTAKVLYKEN